MLICLSNPPTTIQVYSLQCVKCTLCKLYQCTVSCISVHCTSKRPIVDYTVPVYSIVYFCTLYHLTYHYLYSVQLCRILYTGTMIKDQVYNCTYCTSVHCTSKRPIIGTSVQLLSIMTLCTLDTGTACKYV